MFKRIVAIAGIVLLLGTYVATFVCALTATEAAKGMFFTSLGMTIVVPIALWVLLRLYDRFGAKDNGGISVSEMRKYNKRLKNGENPETIAEEIDKKYNNENK